MTRSSSFLALASLIPLAIAVSNTVVLPYGTIQGVSNYSSSSGTILAHPVTAFFSIPYATATRFRYANPPAKLDGTLSLTTYGSVCPQATGTYPLEQQSEECLTLSVFVPEGVEVSDDLPVVVWVPGGAFNSGGGRGFNMPSMVGNAPTNSKFIGVSINYRLGALGFLSSTLTKEANLLNIGFNDITKSLQWVQSHISKFGGDPEKVTLFGESAGAHASGFQFLNVDAGSKKLFRAIILNSGGPTARAYPKPDYPLYETQTKEFLNIVGCDRGTDSGATFGCLRELELEDIRNARCACQTASVGTLLKQHDFNVSLFNRYNPTIRWPFQPVIDGKFIPEAGSQSLKKGNFNKIPVITGYNTDEGTSFVPANLNTTTEFRSFFATLIPAANDSVLNEIETLYPAPDAADSPYADSLVSPQFSRVAAAYGDYAYIQAIRDIALAVSDWESTGAQVFKYHFNGNVSDAGVAAFYGVYHAGELAFVAKTSKRETATIMNAHYASFIVTGGDPNALVPANYTHWPVYSTTNQVQLRFLPNDTTVIEEDTLRRAQLDYWRSIPDVLTH